MPAANPPQSSESHHHCRRHYCPAILPPPLVPTKPAARFLYAWADAVLHESTFYAFIAAHPDDFPVTSGSGVGADLTS